MMDCNVCKCSPDYGKQWQCARYVRLEMNSDLNAVVASPSSSLLATASACLWSLSWMGLTLSVSATLLGTTGKRENGHSKEIVLTVVS